MDDKLNLRDYLDSTRDKNIQVFWYSRESLLGVTRYIGLMFGKAVKGISHDAWVYIVVVLALVQLPFTISRFFGAKEHTDQPTPVHKSMSVEVKETKPIPPMLPYRADPFVPLPGDKVVKASDATKSAGQPLDSSPGMMKIVSPWLAQPKPAHRGGVKDGHLLRPGLLAASQPSSFSSLKPMPVLKPIQAPKDEGVSLKLRGVIGFGDARVAVFEVRSGEVAYVRSSELIPETKMVLKRILDDSVLVFDSSAKKSTTIKMLVGRQVAVAKV